MRIELWFDLSSPACFAAHERARKRWRGFGELRWLPFELEPELAEPGRLRRPDETVLPPALQPVFTEHFLPFRPSEVVPATRNALRAHLWVEDQGDARQLEDFRDGAFRRYFERGLGTHLHLPDVLASIVERVGLDPIAFLDAMRDGAGAERLAQLREVALVRGVRRVPAFAFPGGLWQGEELREVDALVAGVAP
ncbi:MAG: DsbA family protein [Halobacteriales archaeon]|nr:DsbA family protein [Halobacteriales archaeon]